jgi:hypothetical protein
MPFDTASYTTFQLCIAIKSGCPPEVIKHHARQVLRRAFDHVVHAEVPLPGDGEAMCTLLVTAADIEGGRA